MVKVSQPNYFKPKAPYIQLFAFYLSYQRIGLQPKVSRCSTCHACPCHVIVMIYEYTVPVTSFFPSLVHRPPRTLVDMKCLVLLALCLHQVFGADQNLVQLAQSLRLNILIKQLQATGLADTLATGGKSL